VSQRVDAEWLDGDEVPFLVRHIFDRSALLGIGKFAIEPGHVDVKQLAPVFGRPLALRTAHLQTDIGEGGFQRFLALKLVALDPQHIAWTSIPQLSGQALSRETSMTDIRANRRDMVRATVGPRQRLFAGPSQHLAGRAELPKQIVPVVFDPVFRELLALEPADDDHCPPRRAVGCGNPLPLLTLRGMPGAPPHGLVPREHRLWRSLQPRRPYRRT
jgi:hypothetical protein